MNEATVDLKYYLSQIESEIKPEVQVQFNLLPKCERSLWQSYKKRVWNITKKQAIHKLPNFEKRGFHDYHLDHKVSVWYGFKNKLDPKMVGGIANLEFIYWKENFKKSIKCDFSRKPNLQTILFI
jgi:hypothetical protein